MPCRIQRPKFVNLIGTGAVGGFECRGTNRTHTVGCDAVCTNAGKILGEDRLIDGPTMNVEPKFMSAPDKPRTDDDIRQIDDLRLHGLQIRFLRQSAALPCKPYDRLGAQIADNLHAFGQPAPFDLLLHAHIMHDLVSGLGNPRIVHIDEQQGSAVVDERQHLGQERNPVVGILVRLLQFGQRDVFDTASVSPDPLQIGIMIDNHSSVFGESYIKFDQIGMLCDRDLECGERVFLDAFVGVMYTAMRGETHIHARISLSWLS